MNSGNKYRGFWEKMGCALIILSIGIAIALIIYVS